ncbi:MAG: hypothetical protein H8E46_03710 [FCB group bacterium]|nr:hypothetical protein [FCB group bacterium]
MVAIALMLLFGSFVLDLSLVLGLTESNTQRNVRDHRDDQNPSATTLARMFNAGLQSAQEEDQTKAAPNNALVATALNLMPDRPAEVVKMWNVMKSHLDKTIANHMGQVASLTVFLDAVEKAILKCDNLQLFDMIWSIRTEASEFRSQKIIAWGNELRAEKRGLSEKISAKYIESISTNSLDEFKSDLRERLSSYMELSGDASVLDGSIANRLQSELNKSIESISKDIGNQHKKDRDGEKIDPVEDDKKHQGGAGTYEQILAKLNKLQACLQREEVAFWFSDAEGTGDLNMLRTNIYEMATRTRELQKIRYSLWATRAIYHAEKSGSWHHALGRLDIGLLHTSVNALYSLTYNQRLSEVKDARERVTVVSTILCKDKVGLQAF